MNITNLLGSLKEKTCRSAFSTTKCYINKTKLYKEHVYMLSIYLLNSTKYLKINETLSPKALILGLEHRKHKAWDGSSCPTT